MKINKVFAFVEFHNKKDASFAMATFNGAIVGGVRLVVQFSNYIDRSRDQTGSKNKDRKC